MYDDKDYYNNVHQHEDTVFNVNNIYTDKSPSSFGEKRSKVNINSPEKKLVSIFKNKRGLSHDIMNNEIKQIKNRVNNVWKLNSQQFDGLNNS